MIKKVSLPKCTGKLAGWFVFLLTLGKRTAGRAQKKKAQEIIKYIISSPG